MSSENLISDMFRRVYWQIATDVTEAPRSSEFSVTFCRSTNCNITGDLNVQGRCAASVRTSYCNRIVERPKD
jgi:NADH:ubiquinone oxidoreductase subunit E